MLLTRSLFLSEHTSDFDHWFEMTDPVVKFEVFKIGYDGEVPVVLVWLYVEETHYTCANICTFRYGYKTQFGSCCLV